MHKLCILFTSTFISLLLLYQTAFSIDYSKTIDSLKQINSQEIIKINTKGKTLYNLSWYYYNSQKFDSAISYARQAFQFSIVNGLDTVIHKSATMLGGVFTTISELDSASFYLRKGAYYFESLESQKRTQFEDELARIYSILANCYAEQSRYDEAYVYYDKSESIFLKTQDTTGLIFNTVSKGNLFVSINLYDRALSEYIKAMTLIKTTGKITMLQSVYTGISTVYKRISNSAIRK